MAACRRYLCVILFAALLVNLATCRSSTLYSNTWVAQVDGGQTEAETIAAEKGLTLLGQVGSLEGFYMLRHNSHPKRSRRNAVDLTSDLTEHPNVIWAEQQVIKKRVKRDYNPHLNDPYFSRQWYLHNTDSTFRGYDHNVLPVWEQGVTGKNVVVSILDDGIEYTHPDLKANYDPNASYDYNSNDKDPAPRPTSNDLNRHGTRCAGEVAAVANNNICVVGVAPRARVGGVRMLDGDVTDAVEASSLSLNPQQIDLYSSSWGPDDDGRTVDGPGVLARKAFDNGVQKGRGGLGSIYVWASGNGGRSQDSCSCDGYTNSIYTLSISSATEHGTSPWYSENCASTLATTFSSGSYDMRKIVTTDLHGRCTDSHTGTSASAPLAAGILALALEVNCYLTWRDMQHLVVRTSSNAKLQSDDFVVNAVGRKVSHKFGYGLLDALALVNLARKWKTVPPQHICREIPEAQQRPIPGTGSLKVSIAVTACSCNNHSVKYLEHVVVVMTLTFTRRGDLTIKLISPRGTVAILLPQRREDYSGSGFTDWEFMSTHTWGEDPKGTWNLEIENHGDERNSGTLKKWALVLYGTDEPVDSMECPTHGWVLDCNRQKCVKCHPSCARCIGPTVNDCIACSQPNTSLVGFSCKKDCTHGTFPNRIAGFCEGCHPTCETCSGPGVTNCSTCAKDLAQNKSTGMCNSVCPQGQYPTDGKCSNCHSNCRTCNGPDSTNCLNCPDDKLLYSFTCVDTCPDGTYAANKGSIRQCLQCHPVCEACYGSSMNSCTLCKSPLHIEGRMCVIQCSPNHSIDEPSPCGNECKTSARNKDNDSHKNSASVIAIAVGSVSAIIIVLLVLGILKISSKRMLRYTKAVKASFTTNSDWDEEEEECLVFLVDAEHEEDTA